MTVAGWIFMLVSISVVLGLVIFCYSKVFHCERRAKQDK